MSLELSANPKDGNEVIERYIVLLLGSGLNPIPSKLHLQKELFILSNFNPILNKFFHFEKHYYGPFSQEISDLLEEPIYFSNSWIKEGNQIKLTENGKNLFESLKEKFQDNTKFQKLLESIKMIRKLYDKLSDNELLLLVYQNYPKFRKKASKFNEIFRNRKQLALSLLKKGLITEMKYKELVDINSW